MARLSQYGGDNVISSGFTVSAPLNFFVGLFHGMLELTTKLEDALDLSCALSELSQSLIFLQRFFFKFLHQFSFKVLVICLFLTPAGQELK